MKSLPMGTAYAVDGIGALGAVIVGIVFLQRAGQRRADLFSHPALLVGIVGLKATSH